MIQEQQYRETVNNSASQWGSGIVTQFEWDLLFHRRNMLGSWTLVRDEVLQGGPEVPDHVLEEQFIETAIIHGCPVGFQLIEGDRSLGSIMWSYITKNRAYRAFSRMINNSSNELLLSQWKGSTEKLDSEVGTTKIIRPELTQGIDIPITGMEQTECYWPCQLLKVLEEYRTYRKLLDLEPGIRQADIVTIPWFSLQKTVEKSDTVEDLAVNTALDVISTLQNNGLEYLNIARIIIQGYNPQPILEEHGQYIKVRRIWDRITNSLESDSDLQLVLEHESERLINAARDKV